MAVDDVSLIPGTPGYYKTDYTIAHPGRVSILIPTCDHIHDLETCVESIYARTTYPDLEILLIENNTKEPRDLPRPMSGCRKNTPTPSRSSPGRARASITAP